MTARLPAATDFERYESFRTDPTRWLPIALDIARTHRRPALAPQVFPNGSNLVVALDDAVVLKIFPPMLRHQFVSERASLSQLRGKLTVPIPEIVAEGERDGWPYLVITRLAGVTGEHAWPTLAEDHKQSLLAQIGAVIAEVQRVPLGPLAALEPRWEDFIPAQIERCRARHERLGLPRRYLDGLAPYLRDAPAILPPCPSPVLLTGEYIPENFMLAQSEDGSWQLSGLFDFGDVMTGWGEYDLLGPSTFMAEGRPARVRSLLSGYGVSTADMTPALARRLMTLLLLHRYSEPLRQVRIDDWQTRAPTLPELESLLWPFQSA